MITRDVVEFHPGSETDGCTVHDNLGRLARWTLAGIAFASAAH